MLVEEETPKAKAKAKRAPSRSPSVREPKVVEPDVVDTPVLDDVEAKVTFPTEEAQAEAKVECPDCGKLMSQKTLRYSHGPNCVSKKQKQAVFTHTGADQREMQNVTHDMIEHEVQRRVYGRREELAASREAMVAKLVQNTF